MNDEKITTPATANAPGLSPDAAQAPSTVPFDSVPADDGNGAQLIAAEVPVVTPTLVVSLNTEKHKNLNPVHHSHVRWHADALVDGHKVIQGVVKDVSLKGVNLLLDHNLQNSKFIKLHIYIPPYHISDSHHILEVTGKIISSVYDSVEDSFRSGIGFIEFTLESDRLYLQSLSSNNA